MGGLNSCTLAQLYVWSDMSSTSGYTWCVISTNPKNVLASWCNFQGAGHVFAQAPTHQLTCRPGKLHLARPRRSLHHRSRFPEVERGVPIISKRRTCVVLKIFENHVYDACVEESCWKNVYLWQCRYIKLYKHTFDCINCTMLYFIYEALQELWFPDSVSHCAISFCWGNWPVSARKTVSYILNSDYNLREFPSHG